MKKLVGTLLLVGLICMSAFAAKPRSYYRRTQRARNRPPATAASDVIPGLLLQVREAVYDANRDGMVNCLDHATTFKYIWDKSYNAADCELVRNYNTRTGMNHIFARVRFGRFGKWQLVETWADNVYFYDVPTIWGSMYDPEYNYYNETAYWMRDAKYWR